MSTFASKLNEQIGYEFAASQQYIAVAAGRGLQPYYQPNYSRLLAFKLGGTAELPPPLEYTPPALNQTYLGPLPGLTRRTCRPRICPRTLRNGIRIPARAEPRHAGPRGAP